MFYYTDVAGVSLGAISIIMLVSRIVDAVTDPMMGAIVDKTHIKWGKASPQCIMQNTICIMKRLPRF